GQGVDLLSFILGMDPATAKTHYKLTLWNQSGAAKSPFHYILIEPLQPKEKAEFKRARLVLNASNYLPRQIWFEDPRGNEQTWDFPRFQANVKLSPTDFAAPKPPAGWQLKEEKTQPPPRVTRPNGK